MADEIGRSKDRLEHAMGRVHAYNYVMSLNILQGFVLRHFHSLARTTFRLVPQRLGSILKGQSRGLRVIGNIL